MLSKVRSLLDPGIEKMLAWPGPQSKPNYRNRKLVLSWKDVFRIVTLNPILNPKPVRVVGFMS